MAYGIRYFARYKDVAGVLREIRFLKDGYAGESTEWLTMSNSVIRDQGASDAMFGSMIVTSQARINLYLKEHYNLTEFVYDRRTIMCQLLIVGVGGGNDKIVWSGWVEPWNAARQWQKPPYQVSLVASCGLAQLSKKKYVNPNNVFKKTGLTIIRECLAMTGIDLDLRVSTHMYENSWTGDDRLGLNSFEINTARYYNQNGEALKCDEIVLDILNKFNAELTQWDNRWVVRSIVDHAADFDRTYLEIPFIDGGELKPASPWPSSYLVNDEDSFTIDGGEIRVLAPITKYRTEVDLGSQIPYFENGNMVLWTDDGLVGWDFSHMPKGNPGWEQYHIGGDEAAASVLKINGKAPGPYEKKRKKKFGQIVGQILLPLFSNNSNSTLHVEPSEWIESSVGRISPGDKLITISFDYETAPFSSNIIIALRCPSATNPDITYWSLPFQENVPASQEYKWIIVPPVNREGVIGKGHIDVSGNPNYPDGGTVGWTYVIYGVPEGEVRRIGGVSGVPVENDDIIISRVSNPGGSQAAVGSSWEVVNARVNIKKGTFEIPINLEAANATLPIPVEEIFIRFYKITEDDDKTGSWYKIYNLKGTIEGFVAKDDASQYATTLERGSKTDEEAEKINLITGDYNPWYSGSLTIPGTNENTKSWRRRPDIEEELSVYRAMMLDRLCMTSRPLDVGQGDLFLKNSATNLSYLHTLLLNDMSNKRMRIVRFSFDDYSRQATVTAIEVKYEEIPAEELRQDSYIPGSRLLNTVPGQGDGIYPTKQDSSNGRISAEDEPATVDDIIESTGANARLDIIFTDITPLEYVAGAESEDSVDLTEFISETFTEINDDQEEEDIFDIKTLIFTLTGKPTWVTEIEIDEDLIITATALAPAAGTYYLYYDVTDPESGLIFPLKIPILVEPSETFEESWPPTFDDIELIFTVGEESTQEVDLRYYMDMEHAAAEGYTFRLITPVPWVSDRSIVFMGLSVTGKPTTVGSWQMVWEIKDAIGQRDIFYVTLTALAAATVTAKALNTTTGVVDLGALPGNFEVPTRFDTSFRILGPHTGYVASLNGGGALGDHVNETREVDFTEETDGTYRIFGSTGELAEVGQYTLTVKVKRGETESETNIFGLTLYDEEYFSFLRSVYVSGGVDLAFLSFENDSVFENDGVEIWSADSLIDGAEHDRVVMNLRDEAAALVHSRNIVLGVSVISGRYVLDSVAVLRPAGKYAIETLVYLSSSVFLSRTFGFEVTGPAEGEGGECCAGGYATNFGNGTDTNYILVHNLNTKDLHVTFQRNTDKAEIELAWRPVALNSIEVGCSARAIPTANHYRALIEPNR